MDVTLKLRLTLHRWWAKNPFPIFGWMFSA